MLARQNGTGEVDAQSGDVSPQRIRHHEDSRRRHRVEPCSQPHGTQARGNNQCQQRANGDREHEVAVEAAPARAAPARGRRIAGRKRLGDARVDDPHPPGGYPEVHGEIAPGGLRVREDQGGASRGGGDSRLEEEAVRDGVAARQQAKAQVVNRDRGRAVAQPGRVGVGRVEKSRAAPVAIVRPAERVSREQP